jgi:Phasin protein
MEISMYKTEQMNAINSATLNAVSRLFTASLGDAERLFKLEWEGSQRAFASGVAALRAMTTPGGTDAFLQQWPKVYAENTQKLLEVNRERMEILSRNQTELVRVLGEETATINRAVADAVNSIIAALPVEAASPGAGNSVKPKKAV